MDQTEQAAGRNQPSLSRHQSATTETIIPSTLNPALFTPLPQFPPLNTPTTVPQSPEEHLQKLISNLLAQHETVKQNLLAVAISRAKEIRKLAQAEIDALPPSASNGARKLQENDESIKKGIEETLRKMRARPKPGCKSEDFELRPTPSTPLPTSTSTTSVTAGGAKPFTFREGGKVVKSAIPVVRTAQLIREETANKIRELVDNSVAEIETYEKNAETHVDVYRSNLEKARLQSRNPSLANVNANERKFSAGSPIERPLPPKGILTNFNPTPIDQRALRKMSREEAGGAIGGAGKSKNKEELRKEEEARTLMQLGAQASISMEARDRAERDRTLQEAVALQEEILRRATPEEAARLRREGAKIGMGLGG